MGIKNLMPKKSTFDDGCKQDESGKVICSSHRKFSDGTTQEVAREVFQFDGQCNAIPTEIWEGEEGKLERLDKKMRPLLKNKCLSNNRPKDY